MKNVEKLTCDFLEEYPDAAEFLDPAHPKPYGKELGITFLCDSDHGHDRATRRSITGMVGFVGSTLVFWGSKRQGAVATSTYSAEFMALRHATEEILHLRYMMRCLGLPVTKPSALYGDNLGVIQNASNKDAEIRKKHVSISFHFVREAIASGALVPFWLKGKNNVSDIMTKQIGGPEFRELVDVLFWQPKFCQS